VIRKQELKQPLFYDAQEIAPPAAGNFYLRLDEAVGDWESLAQPFAAAFDAHLGRPTDPVVYLKIFLIGYLENITYDTDLAERIADSLAIRRFLGYGLTEAPPDHSSISRNRALIGQRCEVAQVLERVVDLCIARGLVTGKEVAVDATLIPANASLSSLRSVKTGKGVREHLREVREHNRSNGTREKPEITNTEYRSATDAEARIAQKPGTPRGMYYKATHVTDGAHGVIVAAGCECADVGDMEAAKPVLAQSQPTLQAHAVTLGTVVADAGYDAGHFHAAVEAMAASPLTNYKQDKGQKPEGFCKWDFAYDARADCYVCPEGQRLSYSSSSPSVGRIYRRTRAECEGCPHQGECLGESPARTIARRPHEASRERNIARCHTEEGRQALRRRRHIVEPPFGHLKTYGGMSRLNCRGKKNATVKVVLAAVAWNLIKLAGPRTRHRPRRPGRSGHCASRVRRVTHILQVLLLPVPRPIASHLTLPPRRRSRPSRAGLLR
jgi:transposase